MPAAAVTQGVIFEDSGCSPMARLKGQSGGNVTQASLSAISYTVIDKTTQAVIVAATSLTIADVIFDSLQTDARWTKDSTGYNFRHDLAAASFPEGNTTYRVEYTFTPVSGAVFRAVFEMPTLNLLGS